MDIELQENLSEPSGKLSSTSSSSSSLPDERKNIPRNFPLYSLPKIYGWHLLSKNKIRDKGKLFKYFGANWWDLALNGLLPLKNNKVTIKTRNASGVVLVNLGRKCTMTEVLTEDTYHIESGQKSIVNISDKQNVILVSDDDNNKFFVTLIGNVYLILIHVEEVISGKSHIKNSVILSDFLLMNGICDTNQYIYTAGLENMEFVKVEKKSIVEETGTKAELAELFVEQWKKVNPRRKGKAKIGIPNKIQFIWVRKDITKKEYGPLKPVFYKYMDTWIERNPGFEINIWTDNPNFIVPKKYENVITIRGPKEIEDLLSKLPESVQKGIKYLYYHHENPGARSDTLRQAILYVEGGVYGDVNDSVCLVNLSKLLKKFDYIIGTEIVMYVNNAVVGARAKHPITRNMLFWLSENAKEFVEEWRNEIKHEEQEDKDNYVVGSTGPIALTSVIYGALLEWRESDVLSDTVILPSVFVYPNYWIPKDGSYWLKPVSLFAHYDRRDYLK